MASTYVCPICGKFSITTMTRIERRNGVSVKDRMCRPCWDDFLDVADAMAAMNGDGA